MTEFVQSAASANWIIAHSLGRKPAVDVFVGGVQVFADVTVTNTQITVAFPSAQTGSVVYG